MIFREENLSAYIINFPTIIRVWDRNGRTIDLDFEKSVNKERLMTILRKNDDLGGPGRLT